MPPVFFFSYARADDYDGPNLTAFYKDLVKEVRSRTGVDEVEVRFKDTEDVPLGADWSAEIAEGLQKAALFVFLWSPSYRRSDWCGKEWQYFQDRVREHQKLKNLSKPLPVMVPVVWVPDEEMPGEVSRLELTNAKTLDNLLLQNGLRGLHKLYKPKYKLVVDAYAAHITKLYKKGGLQPALEAPNLEKLQSPFEPPPPLRPKASFIFVAARRDEIKKYCPTRMEAYGERDPHDWRPYFPSDEKEARRVAYAAAVAVDFEYDYDPGLPQRLNDAINHGAVVFLIDPWSLRVKRCNRILTESLRAGIPRVVTVVAWNERATQAEQRKALKEAIRKVLASHRKATANSPDSLSKLLSDELIRCRTELQQTVPPSREVQNGEKGAPPPISAVKVR
jgi:FxsC-like protein